MRPGLVDCERMFHDFQIRVGAWCQEAHVFFRAQPAIPIGLAFAWGTIGTILSPLVGIIGFTSVVYLARKQARHWMVCLWMTFAMAMANAWWRSPSTLEANSTAPSPSALLAQTHWDTAEVIQFPLREKPALCLATLQSGGFKGETWAIQLPNPQACPLPGSLIKFQATPANQTGATVPGGFDARAWLRRQGAVRLYQVQAIHVLSQPKGRWKWALNLRERLGEVFTAYIPASQVGPVHGSGRYASLIAANQNRFSKYRHAAYSRNQWTTHSLDGRHRYASLTIVTHSTALDWAGHGSLFMALWSRHGKYSQRGAQHLDVWIIAPTAFFAKTFQSLYNTFRHRMLEPST
jgi:hypothetical protein